MVAWLLLLAVGWAVAQWAWLQPFLERPRALWALSRMPVPTTLSMPVQGVEARRVADSYGAPRGRDRSHEGVDIFAPRGTPVVAATRGVVVARREGGLGGRQVWLLGPGRQRQYYAHLDSWASGLEVGDVVVAGSLLGTVGDSGNARGTPPHLHFGLYGPDATGTHDPLPLLRAGTAPR